MRSTTLRIASLVAAAMFSTSCGEPAGITSPANVTGTTASRTLLGPSTVQVVTRNTPLASSVSASATLGLLGGQITLPGTGLKVIVPPGALRKSTRITVTAVAGNQLAYEFAPHGTRFLVPLIVTQNLVGTSAVSGGLIPKPLVAGYFGSLSDLNPLGGTGLVTELLSTSLNLVTKTALFPVFHFSGYLIATGTCESATEESSSASQ